MPAGDEGKDGEKKHEEDVTQLGFLGWLMGLQNQLIAFWEKRDADERKAYKAAADAQFRERKQDLHKKITDDFGNSKLQQEMVQAANLVRRACQSTLG